MERAKYCRAEGLIFILVYLVGFMTCSNNNGSDSFNEEKILDPKLVINGQKFGERDNDFFERINAKQMEDLVGRAVNEQWLNELANGIRSEEINTLFGRHDIDLISTAMPIFNNLPVTSLEKISSDGFTMLWRCSTLENSVPFNAHRMSELQEPNQIVLLPQVPVDMRSFFGSDVLIWFISKERCDVFSTKILETRNIKLAKNLNAVCLSKLDGPTITIDESIMKVMSPDAFEKMESKYLSAETYVNMSAAQLSASLLHSIPSFDKLRTISGTILNKALEIITKDATKSYLVSPSLFDMIPITMMKHFGVSFWSNANPTRLWSLSSAHLVNLPANAFASVYPVIVRKMIINQTSSSHKTHRRLGELIGKLGSVARDDGKHPCHSPINLLAFADATFTKFLSPDCVDAIDPETFVVFNSPTHLNYLKSGAVEMIKAQQLRQIPASAMVDTAKTFLTNLMEAAKSHYTSSDPERVACMGLLPTHISMLKSKSTWSLFNYECFSVLESATLAEISENNFTRISPLAFENISMPPDGDISGTEAMAILLSKIDGDQLAKLGEGVGDDNTVHPCHDVYLEWNKIGGNRHSKVIGKITPKCLALLDPRSYHGMEEGIIGKMDDRVFVFFESATKFAQIPPEAFVGVRKEQIEHIKKDALCELNISHLLALSKNNAAQELRSELIAEIPTKVFAEGLEKKVVLRDDALAGFSTKNFFETSWVGSVGNMLSPLQWQQLGSLVKVEERGVQHPCTLITYDQVELQSGKNQTTTFWKGLNSKCMVVLPFLELLSKKELDLVPDSAFSELTQEQKDLLAPKLGDRSKHLEYAVNCGKYPAKDFAELETHQYDLLTTQCYSELNPGIWSEFPVEKVGFLPQKAFSIMEANTIAKLPLKLLDAMKNHQWKVLSLAYRGLGCSGFGKNQVEAIKFDQVRNGCFHFLNPFIFAAMKQEQFDRIANSIWEEAISEAQVSEIPAKYFSEFTAADRVGKHWERSSSLHPCHGFASEKIRTMSKQSQLQIVRSCSAVWKEFGSRTPWIFIITIVCTSIVFIVFLFLIYRYLIRRKSHIPDDDHP